MSNQPTSNTETRKLEIHQRLQELATQRFDEAYELSETRKKAAANNKSVVRGRNNKPIYIHNVGQIGKEGKKIWKMWNTNMGNAGAGDIAEAKSWFLQLYNSGMNNRPIPYQPGGMPLHRDEHMAIEAGKTDASQPQPTKQQQNLMETGPTAIHDEIVALQLELEQLEKPAPLPW